MKVHTAPRFSLTYDNVSKPVSNQCKHTVLKCLNEKTRRQQHTWITYQQYELKKSLYCRTMYRQTMQNLNGTPRALSEILIHGCTGNWTRPPKLLHKRNTYSLPSLHYVLVQCTLEWGMLRTTKRQAAF